MPTGTQIVEIVHCSRCGQATPLNPNTTLCLDCIDTDENERETFKDFLADSDDAGYDYVKEV